MSNAFGTASRADLNYCWSFSTIGPKRTSLLALLMSAYWARPDMVRTIRRKVANAGFFA